MTMMRMKCKKGKKTEKEPPENQRGARTDLAMEERELWHKEAGQTTKLPGVAAQEIRRRGILTTVVRVLNEEGAKELHKPVGTYVTLELEELNRKKLRAFHRVTETLAGEIADMMKLRPESSVLVVGLGNEAVTPDAVGPQSLKSLLVSRHLTTAFPEHYGDIRPVSALAPGVLGTTGLESAEIVRSVVEKTRPDALVVIDALASRSISRLCTTVQLTDTGIVPGSGVGNSRAAFTRESLGLPVYAIGVPTVTDAGALVSTEQNDACADMIVTPRNIDARMKEIASVIAWGLNLALHSNLTREEIAQFVE